MKPRFVLEEYDGRFGSRVILIHESIYHPETMRVYVVVHHRWVIPSLDWHEIENI